MDSASDRTLELIAQGHYDQISPLTMEEAITEQPRIGYYRTRKEDVLRIMRDIAPSVLAGIVAEQVDVPRWVLDIFLSTSSGRTVSGLALLQELAAYELLRTAYASLRQRHYPMMVTVIEEANLGNGYRGRAEFASEAVCNHLPNVGYVSYVPGILYGQVLTRGHTATQWNVAAVRSKRTILCACPRCLGIKKQWPRKRCFGPQPMQPIVLERYADLQQAMIGLYRDWDYLTQD